MFKVLFICFVSIPPVCIAADWKSIDTSSLKAWSFEKGMKVSVKDGVLILGTGSDITGVKYTGKDFPVNNYELTFEARRTHGSDFFAAATMPYTNKKEGFFTLVNGGWGGAITGLSSVDGSDASENDTAVNYEYKDLVWYRFRVNVSEKKIQVWITKLEEKDGKEKLVVDVETSDRTFSTRFEMDDYKPFGFCSYASEGEIRNIKFRTLPK